MRVLFASANYGEQIVGGAQLSVRLVAEQLVELGHEVGVVCVDPSAAPRERSAAGVHIYRLPAGNVYWHRAARPGPAQRLAWHATDRFGARLHDAFCAVLREFRPDVVHTNVLSGLTCAIWSAADGLSIPIVHTVHDYYLLCANSGMRSKGANCTRPCGSCRLFSAPSRRAAKLVSAVIYVSQHMRDAHEREQVFASRAHVSEIIGAYEPGALPAREPPQPGPLRLGFLGRVAPDKGLDRLLVELRGLDPSLYRLRIGGAGAPDYEAKLREAAQDMPVDFLGRVEPEPFFRSIDVLIVPSLWNEPAGRVVFEAGLSGVPVIVSRRGGLPQMIDYGRLGWSYEPNQPGELARLIQALGSDRAESRRKVAAWQAERRAFAPAHVARRTLEVYHRAIEARGARQRHAAPSLGQLTRTD